MGGSEEHLIISDILAGDAEAYSILVKRYQKPIYNLMMRMTACEEDALDLTQDTFVRAYEKLERFRLSGRFFPWLYTIGMNLARDYLRKRNTREAKAEALREDQNHSAAASAQEEALLERLDAQRVQATLQELSPDYREAVILRYHQGLPMRDVAVALDISVSAAKMRVHRGLVMLRGLLAEG